MSDKEIPFPKARLVASLEISHVDQNNVSMTDADRHEKPLDFKQRDEEKENMPLMKIPDILEKTLVVTSATCIVKVSIVLTHQTNLHNSSLWVVWLFCMHFTSTYLSEILLKSFPAQISVNSIFLIIWYD